MGERICINCKHFDQVPRWYREADNPDPQYVSETCHAITRKVDPFVLGDGWLEHIDVDGDFGCNLWERSEAGGGRVMRVRTFADRLRLVRTTWGLSQTDAANLCGVSRPQWSRWEAGPTEPRLGVLCRIAGELGFSQVVVGWLVAGGPAPQTVEARAAESREVGSE